MTLSVSSGSPVLEAPGAGLPWWELLVVRRVLFPISCRRHDWAAATRMFEEEGRRILEIWDSLPAGRLKEPVLIRRIAGIEDSSRYWSAAMTVEHLCIVGGGVRRIIALLREGKLPKRELRVEEVKPLGKLPAAQVRSDFIRLLEEAPADAPVPPGTGPRCAHPWLGPVDSHGWRCFVAEHQRIHRKQLESIRRGLSD
ncbi:MAG TPA: hypothetical protein VFW45_12065 [Candidatus Polarisedimenticolia bacterium]|nr:hypothetical protein [Candidatus Polarisedimenticolia bacterium]